MKKSIIRNISLGIACLLGVSTSVAIANMYNKAPEAAYAYYEPTLLYNDIYTNRSTKQSGEYEWTGNCVGNTGFKYYKGSYFLLNKGESLSITWHNTDHKLVNYFVVDDINFGTDSDSGTTEGMSYVATVSSPGFTSFTKTMSDTGNFWNGFLFQNGRIVGRYSSDPYYDPNAENGFTTNDITLTFTSTSNQRGRLIFREDQRMYPYAYGKINFILRSDDGKTTYGQKETMYGEEMTPLEDDLIPTKDGSTFLGYYTKVNDYVTGAYDKKYYNADGTGACINDVKGTYYSNTQYLYAKWRGAPYTITFNNNGGEGPESVVAYYNDEMPEITLPTKTHYTFTGYWDSEDESGTKYYNADGSSAHDWDKESDSILYAHYEASMAVLDVGTTEYTWDGNSHSYEYIKFKDEATEQEITDYTIKFSTDEGSTYTSDTKPEFTASGAHVVYYEVSKTGYANLYGEVTVTIIKADSIVTNAPTAVSGLTYTGSAQTLLNNDGTCSGGELQYSLDGTNYSTTIPSATNVGDYVVYYKVVGDDNHNDTAAQVVNAVIAQATPTGYDIPTGLEATYGDNLSSVALPSTWSWKTPTDKVGDAGNRMHTAIYTPTDPNYKAVEEILTISVATADPDPVGALDATFGQKLSDVALPAGWAWDDATQSVGNVGSHDYAAHYTAVDTNHHDKDASITVSVSQAIPTGYDIPTELKATYGDALSSVKLPDNWAWKNPNDKVGNAGDREHIAIYTPTDPNYKPVENTLTVAVAKATPTGYVVPTDIEVPYGVTLSKVALPEGFSWMNPDQVVNNWGENTLKVKYTPKDSTNYDVIENIDIKVNVKWILVDPTQGDVNVVINDNDEQFTVNINIKVEVKTEISTEEKHTTYLNVGNNFIKSNEDITAIYDVKLIRTTNGVEEEIQPSDIKPGTKITVSMAIPEELVGKEFRLLHIHSEDDVSEVTNYSVSEDGKTLMLEVDRLSEFAFIGATDADNGFIYFATISNILVYVFFGIFGLLLIIGAIILIKLLKDRNNLKKESKAYSIAIAAPLAFAVAYTSTIMIVLYVIAALTVIVWVTNLCLYIANKKRKHAKLDEVKKEETKPVEEVKPVETVKEPEPVNEEDEEEVVTVTDEKGNIFNIRYIKSFTAKLIQSPEETKKYYEELKNYVLSYKKTTSRISWHYDSINSGRNQVLKFAIRGKTLCVYYPLNASDYEDSKYKVEAVESKKFEEVPCLYRIKNDRRLGYAKDLIDTVMNNLGLVKGEEQHEVYSDLPYEENKPLIARGLIKELKIQVNKPVEQVVSKKVNEDGDEIITTKDSSGNLFEIRYIKSFTAKLSQASEEVKDYYNELKNYALSYKKANSRVSWHFDSINVGRNQVIKFSIRGKTLCVYYALNANDYLDTKYKVEQVESKKFEEVPCLYRIKNDRRRDYAKDLIDTVMANVPTEKGKESNEDFRIPYESTKALLAKGLIKENKVQVSKQEEQVIESHEDEEGNEVVLSQDNAGNVYETRYVKSFRARLIEANEEAKDYYKELRDYILSYQDVDESISWLYDSINYNREQLFKLNIRGKTLCIYYALDTSKVGEKYKVENSDTKKYSKVPCLYRISNPRRVKLAKELIDRVMRKHKLILGEEYHDTYHLKNKSRDELIKKGLIKEVKILVK